MIRAGLLIFSFLILAVILYVVHSRRVEPFQGFPSDAMCYLGQVPVLFNSTGTELRAYESVPSAETWLGKQKVLEIIGAGNAMPVQCTVATVLYGKQFGTQKMPLAPPAAVPAPPAVPATTAAPPMAQLAPAVPTSAPAPAALPAPIPRAPRVPRAPPRPVPRTRAGAAARRRRDQMRR